MLYKNFLYALNIFLFIFRCLIPKGGTYGPKKTLVYQPKQTLVYQILKSIYFKFFVIFQLVIYDCFRTNIGSMWIMKLGGGLSP
jgi:protein-S-isoprenylcysteine O-methyltransferase Ste14